MAEDKPTKTGVPNDDAPLSHLAGLASDPPSVHSSFSPDSQRLQARIDSLESELAELKSAGSKKQNIIENERWLTSAIKHLFSFDSDGAVTQALADLGQQLQLDGACFHQFQPNGKEVTLHSHWLRDNLCPSPWSIFERPLPEALLQLIAQGQSQIFESSSQLSHLPAEVAAAMTEARVFALAILPVKRRGCTEGFLCLFNRADSSTARNSCQRRYRSRELRLAQSVAEVIDMVVERSQMTRRLAERDTRFQYAMEASRDGLWDWNLDSDQIYFSYSYLRMLGCEDSPPPMTYKTLIEQFIDSEDVDLVIEKLQRAINSRSDHLNLEYRVRNRRGERLWVYSRIKFVERDSTGRPTRAVGINADISHFKDAQQELLNAKLQADAANKTKSEFLNRMSHEIRTPLNAIIGMGHLMRDTAMNRNQLSYLEHIDQAAAHLLHTIDKVLDFSKLDSDKIVLDSIHFDLDEVFGNLLQMTERDAKLKGIGLVVDCSAEVPRYLRGDAVRLSQILFHLVNNAIKFSDAGSILVSAGYRGITDGAHELQFSVRDQGIGMSQERIDGLFVPFSQADTSSRRRFGGTGLGLTLCKHLVELMGGSIAIDSQMGAGSCVTFSACFQASQIGDVPVNCNSEQFAHLRTLIVDDNAIARTVLDKTASGLKLSVDTAASAEEAIAKIERVDSDPEKRYELVLMDWQMPGIDGLQACRMIKQDPQVAHPPAVILVSAYRREEVLKEQTDEEIASFINKPVSQSRLYDAISEIYHTDNTIEPEASQVDALLSDRRVLLAEDNLVNQKVAVALLAKKGVDVTIANNGREVLTIMADDSAHFDAILMDIEMPEMDGFEATHAIRGGCHKPEIPIIALTAQALKGDRERCLNSGMDAYLSKPFEPKSLYSVLAQILDRSRSSSN